MKKTILKGLGAITLAAAMLCGCQRGDTGQSTLSEHTSVSSEADLSEKPATLQFVKGYGIVSSEHPVYVLDSIPAPTQAQDDVTLTLVDAVIQKQTLIVNFLVSDRSVSETPDGSGISPQKYREDIWTAGDGIILKGPDIGEDGCKPVDSQYIAYTDFYEDYGYMRYFLTALFELPSAPDAKEPVSEYAFQVLDFEQPAELSFRQAPEYVSLEALAAAEGSMDTHDGLSVLAVGETVEEGILVDWYRYGEAPSVTASLSYTPPLQKGNFPLMFSGETEYPSPKSLLYADKIKLYTLEGIVGGQSFKQLFLVPKEAQNSVFTLKVPGITYISAEESSPVTIPIPKDSEELTEEIPFFEGSVRLHKITKMIKPQEYERTDSLGNTTVSKRPAVYLDVSAAGDGRKQHLKSLICQRKAGKNPGESGWENQRYDFDDAGNLSGFRIFYDEGDTEIILKFSKPGFYREVAYEMECHYGHVR